MPDTLTGTRVGRYEVLEPIGAGGMGAVHRGRDPALDRDVAIKVVSRPTRSGSPRGGVGNAEAEARLLREGQALARLGHPNVVGIFDVGRSEHGLFVAMELIEGQRLDDWLADTRPSRARIIGAFVQAGRGLAAGHALGIVHRDFKPANVMVDRGGRVRVLDFGLARLRIDWADTLHGGRADPGEAASDLLSTQITEAGALMGTPLYMAPEQHRGEEATPLSDQFSFCLAAYEAIGGAYPYDRRSVHTVAATKAQGPPSTGAFAPREVWRALLRGLATEPGDRWTSMHALLQRLDRSARPRRGAWIAAGAVAMTAASLAWAKASTPGLRCTGGTELDPIWNGGRVDTLQHAFEQAAPRIGGPAFEATRERVDAWADQWSGAHQRACERGRAWASDATLDLQMACLRGQADELRALLDALEQPAPETVARAFGVAGTLPRPDACHEVTASEIRDAAPPRIAAEVEDVRAMLRTSRAAYGIGRPDDGLRVATDAVTRARQLEHPPLLADALIQRGGLARLVGERTQAIDDLEAAYFIAAERSDAHRAGIAASRLVFAHAAADDRTAAETWTRHTRAAIERSSELAWIEIVLLNALADLERRGGRLEESLALYERARALYAKDPGELEALDDVRLLQSAAHVHAELGHHDQAVSMLRAAVDQAEHHGGEHHPTVASGLTALGNALWYRDDAVEAVEVLQRAEDLAREIYDAGHPRVLDAMGNRAGALVDLGRAAEAVELYDRAIEHATRRPDQPDQPDEARIARFLGGKGRALGQLDRHDEAVAVHRRALEIRRALLPADHPQIGISAYNLGIAQQRTGDHTSAHDHLALALQIFTEALGPDHPRTQAARKATTDLDE